MSASSSGRRNRTVAVAIATAAIVLAVGGGILWKFTTKDKRTSDRTATTNERPSPEYDRAAKLKAEFLGTFDSPNAPLNSDYEFYRDELTGAIADGSTVELYVGGYVRRKPDGTEAIFGIPPAELRDVVSKTPPPDQALRQESCTDRTVLLRKLLELTDSYPVSDLLSRPAIWAEMDWYLFYKAASFRSTAASLGKNGTPIEGCPRQLVKEEDLNEHFMGLYDAAVARSQHQDLRLSAFVDMFNLTLEEKPVDRSGS